MENQTNNTSGSQQSTSQPTQTPVQSQIHDNTLMGILSYIGPLVFIPFVTSKNDPFVKFHINQGLVVFSIEIALFIITLVMPFLYMIAQLVNLGALVLSILGIINVVQKKETPLPVVGSFSKYFTF